MNPYNLPDAGRAFLSKDFRNSKPFWTAFIGPPESNALIIEKVPPVSHVSSPLNDQVIPKSNISIGNR